MRRALRFLWRLVHSGLGPRDRRILLGEARRTYHRIPLSPRLRRVVSDGVYLGVIPQIRALWSPRFRPFPLAPAPALLGHPDYFVWGMIDWHFREQRPQHLARQIAESGRRVFYVSSSLIHSRKPGFEVEPIDTSGRLFQVRLFARTLLPIQEDAPDPTLVKQLRQGLGQLLDWIDHPSGDLAVSLIQHPFWYPVASVVPHRNLVYDCMDHHAGFGDFGSSLQALEEATLRQAELSVTTSAWLDQKVAPLARHRALVRNAADFEHFASPDAALPPVRTAAPPPPAAARPATSERFRDPEGRRVLGYFGALHTWFDVDLVEAVARRFPDCLLLLIGRDSAGVGEKLAALPNVRLTGEVPYSNLPVYLHGFDVGLLPFRVTPLTQATNPVKVYEYLSAGKPVVAVDLPEMQAFAGLVRTASSTEGFLEQVDAALRNLEADGAGQQEERRGAFAASQTWAHRAQELMEAAESPKLDPRISVVIVTYNNWPLTARCLESLERFGAGVRLEIIVVDNASFDGTPTHLAAWAEAGQQGDHAPGGGSRGREARTSIRRRIILNVENRGFAAANNQGLEVATGDYLVLLNNDTYVTPGWLRTMVAHLERDPTLGLIGPVTQNIGNEAKIDADYRTMDEMLATARAFTRQRLGDLYPMRNAAFFCVMMPRAVYAEVGPLDEAFGLGFFEDDDYCRRVEQSGRRIVCADDVFVHHHLSASFGKLAPEARTRLFEENRTRYEAKWGPWIPHRLRNPVPVAAAPRTRASAGLGSPGIPNSSHSGHCTVCGHQARFFCREPSQYRESLTCSHCRSTSRYRSIARGILRAIEVHAGIRADSLATLPRKLPGYRFRVYDTQVPFRTSTVAYPIPDLLRQTRWIDVALSQYRPDRAPGESLGRGITNQNLEELTFADGAFDLVITSDVMEHVRLDDRAHAEIHRVLAPGGVYLFTVPHDRDLDETLVRVQVTDPSDPSRDVYLLAPEYHGDANSLEGTGSLAYRVYGRDLDRTLKALGFCIDYTSDDVPEAGIRNTELFFCTKES